MDEKRREHKQERGAGVLPREAIEYIEAVVRKIGYRRAVREQVRGELYDHFEAALNECEGQAEREKAAQGLIEEFGRPAVLGRLIRRGKKRCRPLWKQAVIRSLQGTGVLIVAFVLYTVWFVTGESVVRVDYLALWNERARPVAAETTNAWPDYERAIELYVEPAEESELERLVRDTDTDRLLGRGEQAGVNPWERLSEQERVLLEEWLVANEGAWAAVEAGSKKEYCWRAYECGGSSMEGLLGVLLPHTRVLRELAKLGLWRVQGAVERGEAGRGIEDALTIVQVGRHWQNPEGTLIEQLVGLAISRLGHEGILRVLASGTWEAGQLKETQRSLVSVYGEGYPHVGLGGERLIFVDVVQRVFTEGGPGGGHIIPTEYARLLKEIRGSRWDFEELGPVVDTGIAMLHAGREETMETFNGLWEGMEREIRLRPYEMKLQGGEREEKSLVALSPVRYGLVRTMVPYVTRCGELSYRGKALHEAVAAVLALKRWRAQKGAYPEGLGVLVEAGYLAAWPMDPYSAGALRYERRGEEFVLYSVGGGVEDDGGVQVEKSYWGEGEGGGDRVFWPVGK